MTYTINVVLWQQVGYFDLAAGSKPLLHMWSLSIEEQFYIFFPALLFFMPRRLWLSSVVGLGVASFAACAILAYSHPSAAFYLLPFRSWELMIGASGAMMASGIRDHGRLRLLVLPSILLILALSVMGTGLPHPGLDALLVCAATIVIICAHDRRLEPWLATRILARVGDLSYSLYLVHWPVIVFLNSSAISGVTPQMRLLALLVAVVGALLLFRYVEEPFRKMAVPGVRKVAVASISGLLVLIGVQFAVQVIDQGDELAFQQRPNYGLDRQCDYYKFENNPACRTAEEPETLIWGDSYAMFVASGASDLLPAGLMQATYSGCPSFEGYAPFNPKVEDAHRISRLCIEFNDGVLRYVRSQHHLKTVILAASYGQYTVDNYKMMYRNESGGLEIEASGLRNARSRLSSLVSELRSAGLEVIVVKPPPGAAREDLTCAERKLSGKITFGEARSCGSPSEQYRVNARYIEDLMLSARNEGAEIIRLSDAICPGDECHVSIRDTLLYRDEGHLSYEGARMVVKALRDAGKLPPPFG